MLETLESLAEIPAEELFALMVGEMQAFFYAGYPVLANASKAFLLRIDSAEPFRCTIWRFLRSARTRVTVSREVPIIWPI
jgi:hypothetical protein